MLEIKQRGRVHAHVFPLLAGQPTLQETGITRDPEHRLRLASGLPPYTPTVILDPEEDEVVYLELVSPPAGGAR